MSPERPAAGGESCKEGFLFIYSKLSPENQKALESVCCGMEKGYCQMHRPMQKILQGRTRTGL